MASRNSSRFSAVWGVLGKCRSTLQQRLHFVFFDTLCLLRFSCAETLLSSATHATFQVSVWTKKNQPIVVSNGLETGACCHQTAELLPCFCPVLACGGSFLYSVGHIGGQGALANPCPVLWRCRSTVIAAVYQLLFFHITSLDLRVAPRPAGWWKNSPGDPRILDHYHSFVWGKGNENEAKQPICLCKVTQETKHGKLWRLKVTHECSNLNYNRSI